MSVRIALGKPKSLKTRSNAVKAYSDLVLARASQLDDEVLDLKGQSLSLTIGPAAAVREALEPAIFVRAKIFA